MIFTYFIYGILPIEIFVYICLIFIKTILLMKNFTFILILAFISIGVIAQKNITVEDIYQKGTFRMNSVHGINSMNDGKHYTSLNLPRNTINKYKYETGEIVKTLFKASDFNENLINWIFDYSFNLEETKILFSVQHESIYRHSFKAEYFIYDIENNELSRLSENGKQQLASFSPDGSKVAFVRDNNIYMKDITISNSEEIQLTSDGKRNEIINGAPDWVYEEEFSFSKAFQWSPCSQRIAFYKTDEIHVKTFSMTIYGDLYPEKHEFKYPKAGEENSNVSIHIIDVNSKNTINTDLGNMDDKYIPRIFWTQDKNILGVIKLNRLQNKYELILVDAKSGNSQVIITIEDEKYIEISDNILFINNNKNILLTHEQSGFNHIYLYDINGNLVRQLTDGEWEVTKFYGYDRSNNVVYFQCAKSSPFNRDVYSVDLNGENLTKMSDKEGNNDFVFSKEFKYYINNYSSFNSPLFVTLHDSKGNLIRELEKNESLVKRISEDYKFVDKEFFSFTTTEGVELNGWMIKPPNFKSRKEHPVLMYVYGGPGHQTVLNSWDRNMAWWQMLAQKGYIVVSVDNRGTGARGKEFRQVTYGQLGKYETIDQIEAAKYLGSLRYVDENRIGVFGWSYGGYMAALCMTIGAEFFKLGIAVAPVSNWRHYDTIYTERYNGLPQDNPEGYDDNSPINHVEKLKGEFLLVHGTGDDNVHVENSIDLANELINANKQFDLMIYPNRNHGIHGGYTRLHLYNMMTNFIVNKL